MVIIGNPKDKASVIFIGMRYIFITHEHSHGLVLYEEVVLRWCVHNQCSHVHEVRHLRQALDIHILRNSNIVINE
ncbi:LOW QUALITY PROTEIN: hypothetical protein RJ641_014700 [Dillenia turbinata]|uniref:Uncharacterized protein n=1 Tax=Dillenia turbinata TaxID=194707 RepID=A0AAN8V1Q3_9MAGN